MMEGERTDRVERGESQNPSSGGLSAGGGCMNARRCLLAAGSHVLARPGRGIAALWEGFLTGGLHDSPIAVASLPPLSFAPMPGPPPTAAQSGGRFRHASQVALESPAASSRPTLPTEWSRWSTVAAVVAAAAAVVMRGRPRGWHL